LVAPAEVSMAAYAIGHLRNIEIGPEIREYLERIDATLAPFDGQFLIHGARPEIREGLWEGDLVVIGFPDLARARAWYESPAYRELIPLRARNSESVILLLDGVPADHVATDVLG
jgi:uncharacterized protein (DUF1330 family)